MKQPIAIISNPQSGYNKNTGLARIDALANHYGHPHIHATTPQEITQALKSIAAHSPECLVINAGDGTVDLIISVMRNQKIFKTEPALALLKGGTTNMIHRNVHLRGKPDQGLERLLKGDTQTIVHPVLKVQRAEQGEPPLYGFFLGTNAIPRAILKTRAQLHTKGMNGKFSEIFSVIRFVIRLFMKKNLDQDDVLKPATLIQNGDKQDVIFLALTSLKKLISGLSSRATDRTIGTLSMKNDRRLKHDTIERVSLETSEDWILDGEIYSAGSIDIELGDPVRFWIDKTGAT